MQGLLVFVFCLIVLPLRFLQKSTLCNLLCGSNKLFTLDSAIVKCTFSNVSTVSTDLKGNSFRINKYRHAYYISCQISTTVNEGEFVGWRCYIYKVVCATPEVRNTTCLCLPYNALRSPSSDSTVFWKVLSESKLCPLFSRPHAQGGAWYGNEAEFIEGHCLCYSFVCVNLHSKLTMLSSEQL